MQEQQARQQEIHLIKEEISKKDQEILNLESQLKEAEKILVSTSTNIPETMDIFWLNSITIFGVQSNLDYPDLDYPDFSIIRTFSLVPFFFMNINKL